MKDLPMPAGPVDSAAVLADDALLDAVRTGARGIDDPDPLVRLLAAWRCARRRPRTRGRRFGLGCR
ncbi:hypothetical protein SAMN05216377_1172 [Pseudonocardia oroxyli]|uniref:Uncharacterized protein n=2 Tax=Pseudonocardiaceae TaxID=2070 RepID=A0A1G7YBK6_PSEOR|nr:hypothetical protein SAMN05216377_1172 [Pseudonocardia oroxyli]